MTRMTAEQLQNMLDNNEDFLLINTLDAENFSETKIPGAVNIPQARDDFVQKVEKKAGDKDHKIVVYCASEQCNSSPQAAQKLEAAGFSNVHDFEAGAEGWKKSGLALATG
jgi:rhodanese-related sulfurtransferase